MSADKVMRGNEIEPVDPIAPPFKPSSLGGYELALKLGAGMMRLTAAARAPAGAPRERVVAFIARFAGTMRAVTVFGMTADFQFHLLRCRHHNPLSL